MRLATALALAIGCVGLGACVPLSALLGPAGGGLGGAPRPEDGQEGAGAPGPSPEPRQAPAIGPTPGTGQHPDANQATSRASELSGAVIAPDSALIGNNSASFGDVGGGAFPFRIAQVAQAPVQGAIVSLADAADGSLLAWPNSAPTGI